MAGEMRASGDTGAENGGTRTEGGRGEAQPVSAPATQGLGIQTGIILATEMGKQERVTLSRDMTTWAPRPRSPLETHVLSGGGTWSRSQRRNQSPLHGEGGVGGREQTSPHRGPEPAARGRDGSAGLSSTGGRMAVRARASGEKRGWDPGGSEEVGGGNHWKAQLSANTESPSCPGQLSTSEEGAPTTQSLWQKDSPLVSKF